MFKMDIIQEAFQGIYPEKSLPYEYSLKYSGKFNGYNANIKLFRNRLHLSLSKNWRYISNDIKIGLLQELMLKLFKDKKSTLNTDLYTIFMKKIPGSIPKTKSHPILERSFYRVNQKYFFSFIDKPNLIFGNSIQKLGSYDFGTDTVMISKVLLDDVRLMDYVMYHELLHKKHKFHTKNGREHHHTKEFKSKEKEFDNSEELEKSLAKLVRKAKLKRAFGLF